MFYLKKLNLINPNFSFSFIVIILYRVVPNVCFYSWIFCFELQFEIKKKLATLPTCVLSAMILNETTSTWRTFLYNEMNLRTVGGLEADGVFLLTRRRGRSFLALWWRRHLVFRSIYGDATPWRYRRSTRRFFFFRSQKSKRQ